MCKMQMPQCSKRLGHQWPVVVRGLNKCSTNVKDSLIGYSLVVRDSSIGTKIFATVLAFPAFCTIVSLFLRKIFNASNFSLGKFFPRVLLLSLYDDKAKSLSLHLINSLSKLETSKESTSLCNSSKGSIKSA